MRYTINDISDQVIAEFSEDADEASDFLVEGISAPDKDLNVRGEFGLDILAHMMVEGKTECWYANPYGDEDSRYFVWWSEPTKA